MNKVLGNLPNIRKFLNCLPKWGCAFPSSWRRQKAPVAIARYEAPAIVGYFLILSASAVLAQQISIEQIAANPEAFRGKYVQTIAVVGEIKEGGSGMSTMSADFKKSATLVLKGGITAEISLPAFAAAQGVKGTCVVKADGNIWMSKKSLSKIGGNSLGPVLGAGSVVIITGQMDMSGKKITNAQVRTEAMGEKEDILQKNIERIEAALGQKFSVQSTYGTVGLGRMEGGKAVIQTQDGIVKLTPSGTEDNSYSVATSNLGYVGKGQINGNILSVNTVDGRMIQFRIK